MNNCTKTALCDDGVWLRHLVIQHVNHEFLDDSKVYFWSDVVDYPYDN